MPVSRKTRFSKKNARKTKRSKKTKTRRSKNRKSIKHMKGGSLIGQHVYKNDQTQPNNMGAYLGTIDSKNDKGFIVKSELGKNIPIGNNVGKNKKYIASNLAPEPSHPRSFWQETGETLANGKDEVEA